MKNFLMHAVKFGLRKLGIEIRRVQPGTRYSGAGSSNEAILTALTYLLVKLMLLPQEKSKYLLSCLRLDEWSKSHNNNSGGESEVETHNIEDLVYTANIHFKNGEFEKTIINYRLALFAWIKLIESGEIQHAQVIIQEILNDLTSNGRYSIDDILAIIASLGTYLEIGSNLDFAHQSKISLHCDTNAYFNDFLSYLIGICRPPYETIKQKISLLGQFDDQDLHNISQEIHNEGYYVFPERLSPGLCDRLTEFALATPCQGYIGTKILPNLLLYDCNNPEIEGYYIPQQNALDNSDVQALVTDPFFLNVAQKHLEAQPVLASVGMWWSSATANVPNSTMAQLYHFDMDWIKWTNFFIYVTNVTSDTGPHCYIKGTHHRGSKPQALLERGYARISDSELRRYYAAEDFVEITGARGTVIVGDTRCYHKAKHLKAGHRLIINITYANTLWLGGSHKKFELKPNHTPELIRLYQTHPRIFSRFTKPNL